MSPKDDDFEVAGTWKGRIAYFAVNLAIRLVLSCAGNFHVGISSHCNFTVLTLTGIVLSGKFSSVLGPVLGFLSVSYKCENDI